MGLSASGVVKQVKRITRSEAAGPVPLFTSLHVVKSIISIGENEGIGRKRLAAILGLGEGSTRTMLERMEEAGLVRVERGGCKLTRKGQELYTWLRERLKGPIEVDLKDVWGYEANMGFLVKAAAEQVKRGLEQRDAAIRSGAKGAMTLLKSSEGLVMPGGVSELSREHPNFSSKVEAAFSPSEGDVIVIAGADDRRRAELGALAAALVTLGVED